MNLMRRFWAPVCLIAVLAGFMLTSCSDYSSAHYANMDEARRAGAIARGWIPRCFPSVSSDIWELHNLDTNEIWLKATFPSQEVKVGTCDVATVTASDIAGHHVRRPGVGWWPNALEGRLEESALVATGFRFYRMIERPKTFLAVNRKEALVYMWSEPT